MATLEEFNIACSSSNDVHNIKWIQKNSKYLDNSKKKKTKNSSSTNIIYTNKDTQDKTSKTFKINSSRKTKKNISEKKFQTSESISKIERGFRRLGR